MPKLSPLFPVLLLACGAATARLETPEAGAPETTKASPPDATATRVQVATLESSTAGLNLRLPGEVIGSRDAVLAAPLGGYVEAVLVKAGDAVNKGDAIARIDASTYAARARQADARAALAKAELERVRTLGDLASAAQLQGAETTFEIADADADLARIQLSRSSVRAPFSGVVGQLALEPGEVLAPGAPVARLVQLDPIHVSVSVGDRDINTLKVGMPVTVSVDASADPASGEVAAIDPVADLKTRAFTAKISVPNPDGALKPGMIATVAAAAELDGRALIIPQDWLVTRIDAVGVFVHEDGVARWRAVETGDVVYDQVVIERGVTVGEQVVVKGHRTLQDGDPLLVAREGTCCVAGRAVWSSGSAQ